MKTGSVTDFQRREFCYPTVIPVPRWSEARRRPSAAHGPVGQRALVSPMRRPPSAAADPHELRAKGLSRPGRR